MAREKQERSRDGKIEIGYIYIMIYNKAGIRTTPGPAASVRALDVVKGNSSDRELSISSCINQS